MKKPSMLLLLVALTLSACGKGSDSNSGTTTSALISIGTPMTSSQFTSTCNNDGGNFLTINGISVCEVQSSVGVGITYSDSGTTTQFDTGASVYAGDTVVIQNYPANVSYMVGGVAVPANYISTNGNTLKLLAPAKGDVVMVYSGSISLSSQISGEVCFDQNMNAYLCP